MSRIFPVPAFLLVVFSSSLLFGQESKQKPENDSLPYVPRSANQVVVIRPAKIQGSGDYRELETIAGNDLKKVVQRMRNRYLKFGLADLEEIDSLVFAQWVHVSNRDGDLTSDGCVALIMNTVGDNLDRFDLATHAVEEESEFQGKTIFKMKQPLDGFYRYASIVDDRCIVWGTSKLTVENSISAGRTEASKAEWYRPWREFADEKISFTIVVNQKDWPVVPPYLKGIEGLQFVTGGADVAKSTWVNLLGMFETAEQARDNVEVAQSRLQALEEKLQQRMEKYPDQQDGIEMMLQLVKSAQFEHTNNVVRAKARLDVDFRKLTKPLNEINVAEKRAEAATNLRQSGLGIHNYHSAFDRFPSPVMVHESGKKYSWRIAILPYIGHQDIYDKYDFTQDWDSPHNLEVTSKMPDYFRSDTDDPDTTNTSFFMLTGPGAMFDGENAIRYQDITDGTSNTIMAIEARREVHWAKPEDIVIDLDSPLPEFGGFHRGGFNIVRADGSVSFFPENISEEALRKLFTPSGGEIAYEQDILEKDE